MCAPSGVQDNAQDMLDNLGAASRFALSPIFCLYCMPHHAGIMLDIYTIYMEQNLSIA